MKKILIYSQIDPYFTNFLLNHIVNKYINYQIELYVSKPSLKRWIKTIIAIILFSKLSNVFKVIKNRVDLNSKIKIVKEVNKNYHLILCIGHQNKIKIPNKRIIYNFHLGSLSSQRGSFIFFHKFKYNWNYIFLTCHQMTNFLDKGKIINQKKIYSKDLDAIEILNLYKKNIQFIFDSINLISKKKNFYKINISKPKQINKQPTYFEIIKISLKGYIKILGLTKFAQKILK